VDQQVVRWSMKTGSLSNCIFPGIGSNLGSIDRSNKKGIIVVIKAWSGVQTTTWFIPPDYLLTDETGAYWVGERGWHLDAGLNGIRANNLVHLVISGNNRNFGLMNVNYSLCPIVPGVPMMTTLPRPYFWCLINVLLSLNYLFLISILSLLFNLTTKRHKFFVTKQSQCKLTKNTIIICSKNLITTTIFHQ